MIFIQLFELGMVSLFFLLFSIPMVKIYDYVTLNKHETEHEFRALLSIYRLI